MKRNWRLIKKSFEYFAPFKWSIIVVIVMILVQSVFTQSSSYFLGKVVDAAMVSNLQMVFYFILAYIACSRLIPTVISRIRYIYELRTSEYDLFNHVQKVSLFKSLSLSLGQLRREHSGFKQDVLKSGENGIDYFHYLITDDILPTLSSFVVAGVGLFIIDPRLALIALIYVVIHVAYGSYINASVREPMRDSIKKRIERNKVYVDLLRSLFFIKFSNQKNTAKSHLAGVQKNFRDQGVKMWSDFQYKMILSDLFMLIYYFICAYIVFKGVSAGTFTAGSIIPIFSWMSLLTGSMSRLRDIQRRSNISFIDLEKMFDMLEQKTDIHIEPNARPIKVFEDRIVFESVSFDYREGKKGALQNINFEIKKGEKVALVGRSGSGKTTIVSLLLRLHDPTAGAIMVDMVELKSLVLEDWHNLIAYVQQDGDLLDISIRDNILFGAKHTVTEPEIEAVLDKAGIKEFIHNLPHGIDTLVGERGVKLSGGQKQRVCIARALIKDAPILLLDEATSSLDSETESVVNKAVWEMLGNKTGVVIAHRLSTILDADKIVVMDHGEIVGIGTHEELLKTTPYYKKLVDAQNVNL